MGKCKTCRRKKGRGRHKCPTFECDSCNKTFNRKDLRDKHSRTHLNQSLSCDQCENVFKTTETLKQHQQTHIIIECDICHTPCNKRTINTHKANNCNSKRGAPTTYSKLSTESIHNICKTYHEADKSFGNPTVAEVRTMIQDEVNQNNTTLFRESNVKRKSQQNVKAVKRFCKDNNLKTRNNYDVIVPPNDELTPLQVISRAKTDATIYYSMTRQEDYAIQHSCVIKTTSNAQEKKKRKKLNLNRDIDFSNGVWDAQDIRNIRTTKANKNKKKPTPTTNTHNTKEEDTESSYYSDYSEYSDSSDIETDEDDNVSVISSNHGYDIMSSWRLSFNQSDEYNGGYVDNIWRDRALVDEYSE